MDIYIGGVRDRNAALHGDVVVVEIKPIDQWKVRMILGKVKKKQHSDIHRFEKNSILLTFSLLFWIHFQYLIVFLIINVIILLCRCFMIN